MSQLNKIKKKKQWSMKCPQYDLITNYYLNHYIMR